MREPCGEVGSSRTGMINIRRPGEPMDHRTSEDYHTTGLIVDAGFVHRVAASLRDVAAESILRGPFATIDPRICVSLDRSLRSALARLAPGHDAEASAGPVEEFLIDWLSAVLAHLVPESRRESRSVGPRHRAQSCARRRVTCPSTSIGP